jgi:iron-sulfur cluster repair protein YtfE (RIC family)
MLDEQQPETRRNTMHTPYYGQNTVDEVIEHIPEAGHVLRAYDVGAATSHNLRLDQAAQAVTVSTDEMLAVMEYRARRAAQQLSKK